MARPWVGREILVVHALGADLVSGCNPLLRVLAHCQWLMMPAWFVACHACVIISNIPTMCVAHVPIVELFDSAFVIVDRLALLRWWWGGIIPCVYGMPIVAAGGTPYALYCCPPPPWPQPPLPFPRPRPRPRPR